MGIVRVSKIQMARPKINITAGCMVYTDKIPLKNRIKPHRKYLSDFSNFKVA
jgi:hypothetical protein